MENQILSRLNILKTNNKKKNWYNRDKDLYRFFLSKDFYDQVFKILSLKQGVPTVPEHIKSGLINEIINKIRKKEFRFSNSKKITSIEISQFLNILIKKSHDDKLKDLLITSTNKNCKNQNRAKQGKDFAERKLHDNQENYISTKELIEEYIVEEGFSMILGFIWKNSFTRTQYENTLFFPTESSLFLGRRKNVKRVFCFLCSDCVNKGKSDCVNAEESENLFEKQRSLLFKSDLYEWNSFCKGIHTSLQLIKEKFLKVNWLIEGKIGFINSIDKVVPPLPFALTASTRAREKEAVLSKELKIEDFGTPDLQNRVSINSKRKSLRLLEISDLLERNSKKKSTLCFLCSDCVNKGKSSNQNFSQSKKIKKISKIEILFSYIEKRIEPGRFTFLLRKVIDKKYKDLFYLQRKDLSNIYSNSLCSDCVNKGKSAFKSTIKGEDIDNNNSAFLSYPEINKSSYFQIKDMYIRKGKKDKKVCNSKNNSLIFNRFYNSLYSTLINIYLSQLDLFILSLKVKNLLCNYNLCKNKKITENNEATKELSSLSQEIKDLYEKKCYESKVANILKEKKTLLEKNMPALPFALTASTQARATSFPVTNQRFVMAEERKFVESKEKQIYRIYKQIYNIKNISQDLLLLKFQILKGISKDFMISTICNKDLFTIFDIWNNQRLHSSICNKDTYKSKICKESTLFCVDAVTRKENALVDAVTLACVDAVRAKKAKKAKGGKANFKNDFFLISNSNFIDFIFFPINQKIEGEIFSIRYGFSFLIGISGTHKTSQNLLKVIEDFIKNQLSVSLEKINLILPYSTETNFLDYQICFRKDNKCEKNYSKIYSILSCLCFLCFLCSDCVNAGKSDCVNKGILFSSDCVNAEESEKILKNSNICKDLYYKQEIKDFTFSGDEKLNEMPYEKLNNFFIKRQKILYNIPLLEIIRSFHKKGFCDGKGFPTSKGNWTILPDSVIVSNFNKFLKSLEKYYSLIDSPKIWKKIEYILQHSCGMTIAHKHRTSLRKIFSLYKKNIVLNTRKSSPSSITNL